MNLTIFSFLSAMMKTNKEWNEISTSFVLFFIFAVFDDCYQFSQNETNRHSFSFWIVIWESVILIKLVEMIKISTAFAKHVLNLFCFVSSIWFEDCWKGEMWKEVWNLLVRNNWWNSRKKERKKSAIFRICQTGWNSLAIGLAEWLKLVANKQTTISIKTELDFLLLLSASERNAVSSSFHPIFSAFLEWLLREQEHLNRENGNEMEKYLLLANRQCI